MARKKYNYEEKYIGIYNNNKTIAITTTMMIYSIMV
jgi:hypothetical protein